MQGYFLTDHCSDRSECLKSDEAEASGNAGEDHNRIRYTASDESEHPGRRQFCRYQRRHELQAISIPGKRKRDGTERSSGHCL